MSLTKKDPSLRVAANDPHLVSLGGGRLSTAVTIHYIPTGHTTIGSSSSCSISLNGVGVQPNHCTIYRSDENEVYIVPETNASLLLDGIKITKDTQLSQGAMLTIGQYNLLRFNNPAEAELMRSAMDSNEKSSLRHESGDYDHRNSTKSIDSNASLSSFDIQQAIEIENFYQSTINPLNFMEEEVQVLLNGTGGGCKPSIKHVPPIDINSLQCPKVFTADLVTVNMPAKDVLGQKYASFAKNLAENHRQEKQINNSNLRNNQVNLLKQQNQGLGNQPGNYVNIPSTTPNFIQNPNMNPVNKTNISSEYLAKVNNTSPLRNTSNHNGSHPNSMAYDRYPKPGSYGGLQIYPLNGINTEINNWSNNSSSPLHQKSYETSPSFARKRQLTQLSNNTGASNDGLEDMLKICSEYSERQNHSSNSITSSPIVQNRIKTNGSLPREKKSPFHHELSNVSSNNFSGSNSNLSNKPQNSSFNTSTGYENVRLTAQNRIEINGQMANHHNYQHSCSVSINSSPSGTGYENVIVGKYVPQSPRTKIRTTCISPKKDYSFTNFSASPPTPGPPPPPNPKPLKLSKQTEYEQLIRTFEEKLKIEMQAIEESSRYRAPSPKYNSTTEKIAAKRSNKNINNLTLTIHQQPHSLQNSPKLSKKPAPAPRNLNKTSSGSCGSLQFITEAGSEKTNDLAASPDQMKAERRVLLASIQALKEDITELRKQEDEVLRDLDLEKALISAELYSVGGSVHEHEKQLEALQEKIRRLEAQRNATRVMEENQQAKLKQSIEMKQDQIKKLKEMLNQKPNNECLKEEIHNVSESLENERKAFEDLEFQYLEEESEWHAYREELHAEETTLSNRIREKRLEFMNLEKQELSNQVTDAKSIKQKLMVLCRKLKEQQDQLKSLEQNISDITGELQISSSDEEESKVNFATSFDDDSSNNLVKGVMSQSLFGSAELLCPKRSVDDSMSKSVNENMFYNNKIELPNNTGLQATSTPKRPQLRLIDIDDSILNDTPPTPVTSKVSNFETTSPDVREEPPLVLRIKRKTTADGDNDNDTGQSDRLKCNLSLGSDDFEVNPLEKRVPSQDDIDRICKVTLDAPISTKGAATTKIFDSIKEIERNRQLLLAQQGHHVIEHERQKMNDLKKKSHDEARAQYISMLSQSNDGSSCSDSITSSPVASNENDAQRNLKLENELQKLNPQKEQPLVDSKIKQQKSTSIEQESTTLSNPNDESSQQRHSQPEFESQHYIQEQQKQQLLKQQLRNSRPLSEANSEFSCGDPISDGKSSLELSTTNTSSGIGDSHSQMRDDKRASSHSNDTSSATISLSGSGVYNERKRPMLPKHQRPLTRYLPIFSPDLNLRQHIESAGHQIALCPHVFVDSFSCRGYLHKLGATFHGWARRWFVLDRQRKALIYYSDKSERKPRGGAYFSTIDEVYLDHLNASKSGRPHCTFIVKTKKRSYHLQAASDAAARIWIDAIITGAQGNLEY